MFSDTPETVEMLAVDWIIDQVIDWFGKDIKIDKTNSDCREYQSKSDNSR